MKIEPRKGGGWWVQLAGETKWRRYLPAVFTAENAQKIALGRKTQTRRLLKPQPHEDDPLTGCGFYHPTKVGRDGEEHPGAPVWGAWNNDAAWVSRWQPGDVLWIQEPWRTTAKWDYVRPSSLFGVPFSFEGQRYATNYVGKLRQARFMPERFARTRVLATGVGVERVRDITEDDAKAEGCDGREGFALLWNTIHAAPGTRWDDNPWVWIYSFNKC